MEAEAEPLAAPVEAAPVVKSARPQRARKPKWIFTPSSDAALQPGQSPAAAALPPQPMRRLTRPVSVADPGKKAAEKNPAQREAARACAC